MNVRTTEAAQPTFAEEMRAACGQDANLCFECWKCTSGCPLAEAMDLTPTQVVHSIRVGDRGAVLESATIWICASCETCTTRCPQGIEVARFMDVARTIVRQSGMRAAVPEIRAFYDSILQSIRMFGRLYEVGMMAALKLKTSEFTKDMDVAVVMVRKGKIKLVPHVSHAATARRILADPAKAGRGRAGGAAR